jgi:hypothetical protein
MEPTDLTIEILKGIRDEVRMTREELSIRIGGFREELSERIDGLRGELSGRIDRLADCQLHMETHVATELVAVASAVGLVTNELREMRADARRDRGLRARVDEHERRLGELEKKTG